MPKLIHKWDDKKGLVMRCGSKRWTKGNKFWPNVTCKNCQSLKRKPKRKSPQNG